MEYIDVRSDTVTRPTPEMRRAMAEAEVGDDTYGEDPSVNRLEAYAAELTGKEAALFVTSGTMGNQIAIMAHTRPGDELIASPRSHIVHYEAGGAARLSGVGYALVDSPDQIIRSADIRRLVRPLGDPHFPVSRLVCLENALSNGDVVPMEVLEDTCRTARGCGLRVHLDGARLFNAAHALGVEARDIAAHADSVMFCISKGLCAPVGSMLCGDAAFIAEARRCRKLLGGGMRQVGVLAACGTVALEGMLAHIETDHRNARLLGQLLADIPGVRVELDTLKINMVFWSPQNPAFDHAAFVTHLLQNGVKVSPAVDGVYRFVLHNDVSRQDVETLALRVGDYLKQ